MNECQIRMFETILGVETVKKGLNLVNGESLLCSLVTKEVLSLRDATKSLSKRLKAKEQLCLWRPTAKEQWAKEHPEEWMRELSAIKRRGDK